VRNFYPSAALHLFGDSITAVDRNTEKHTGKYTSLGGIPFCLSSFPFADGSARLLMMTAPLTKVCLLIITHAVRKIKTFFTEFSFFYEKGRRFEKKEDI